MHPKAMDDDSNLTRFLGFFMITTSSIGLFFNFRTFYHFLSLEKSSFYIMCISKTISNSIVLLCFLIYNGVSSLFHRLLFTRRINRLANQAVSYGIYSMGPLTQVLITINRFFVVFCSPTTVPRYSIAVTVAGLSLCWIIAIYLTFLWGFPENCLMELVFPPDWSADECSDDRVDQYLEFYIHIASILGVFSNIMNALVAAKLVCRSKSQNQILSSESTRRRQKTTIRLFIQSCFQDWIYIIDLVNSIYVRDLTYSEFSIFMVTLGSDMCAHVADGVVMYIFNCRIAPNRKKSQITVISPKLSGNLK